MAGKKVSKSLRRMMRAMVIEGSMNTPKTVVKVIKKKKAKKNKVGYNGAMARTPNNAPVAVGLKNRQSSRATGVFKPIPMYTCDLLDVVQLGTQAMTVIYSTPLAPQNLPFRSRAKVMSGLYAKYRPLRVNIRIDSAVPTSSGGQYAAFFDPNPSHDWQASSAVSSLTSMPVKQVGSAWECLTLNIPRSELEHDFELYTYESENEKLVTQFGQIVIINMAVSNTTPPGSASVTVWLEVDWEFYEPNVAPPLPSSNIFVPAGTWTVLAGVDPRITVPTPLSSPFQQFTAYQLFPELPATFLTEATQYIALYNTGNLYGFPTEVAALQYARNGTGSGLQAGSAPSQALSATVAVPIDSADFRSKGSFIRYPMPHHVAGGLKSSE